MPALVLFFTYLGRSVTGVLCETDRVLLFFTPPSCLVGVHPVFSLHGDSFASAGASQLPVHGVSFGRCLFFPLGAPDSSQLEAPAVCMQPFGCEKPRGPTASVARMFVNKSRSFTLRETPQGQTLVQIYTFSPRRALVLSACRNCCPTIVKPWKNVTREQNARPR